MSVEISRTSPAFHFLIGQGPDSSGRYFEEVICFNDRELERKHDYIQWLFPLTTKSASNLCAPVLTQAEISLIKRTPEAQANLRQAAAKLSSFYERTDHWLAWHDHNHLRITRIIESINLLLGRDDAQDFYDTIIERVARAGRPVSPHNMKYWHGAVLNNVRPDV